MLGIAIAARIPMIVITTSSSTRLNPRTGFMGLLPLLHKHVALFFREKSGLLRFKPHPGGGLLEYRADRDWENGVTNTTWPDRASA
jgi:hypothetical protein